MKVYAAVLLLLATVLAVGGSAAYHSATPASEHGAAWSVPDDIDGMPHNPVRHTVNIAAAKKARAKAGFNCIAACSDYEQTINQYFTDVAADSGPDATNVYSVATQYSGITNTSTFDADTNVELDGNPYPTTKACHDGYDTYCVTDAQLETQIGKVIAARGWPTGSSSAVYFIFTPANVGVCIAPGSLKGNACTTNAFCAYHSNSATFIYAVEPDDAAVNDGGCDTGERPAGSYADDTINTISHEQNEAVSDPLGTAWYSDDADTGEMADLCAWDFGDDPGAESDQTINEHPYFLQYEYSNQDNGCVPYLGGPVTPATDDGSGPVANHYPGTVMTTNTVYAIYWIPAAPANTTLPRVTGTSKVGKTLTAARGSWSHAPKSYAYRWLRCSPAGTSCKGITKATVSSYTLVKADAGHRLEVRVTATNPAGSVSAISAPGHPVKR